MDQIVRSMIDSLSFEERIEPQSKLLEQGLNFQRVQGLVPLELDITVSAQLIVSLETPLNIINLDTNPYIPIGWSVHKEDQLPNVVGGQFIWDPTKVQLYLSDRQKNGQRIRGTELREELRSMPVFNANLLDYLYANPHLIPEEWKGKYTFFWGTIYRDANGSLYVRCLYFSGGVWDWYGHRLEDDWIECRPCLVPASLPAGQAG